MKKFTPFILGIVMSLNLSAQDTTDLRALLSGTFPAKMYFLKAGFTIDVFADVLPEGMDSTISTSQALFMHPDNYKLYALLDSGNFSQRSFFEINPLTGDVELIYELGDLFSSAEITSDGRVFAIMGNGGATPGAVYEVDMFNQTKQMVFQSDVPMGEPRALGFDSISQKLLVVSSYIDTTFVYELDTWDDTIRNDVFSGREVHGMTQSSDGTIFLVTYYGEIGAMNLFDNPDTAVWLFGGFPNIMDIAFFKLIDAPEYTTLCAGEKLSALYESNSYAWYWNGVLIPNSNTKDLTVTQPGVYRLVTQIRDTAAYIWSEEITVNLLNSPVVEIMASDTTMCPGDTVILTGSMGGQSQWYRNGMAITGADSNVYFATMDGSYNMMKTNQNGCSDTADNPIVITYLPADTCALGVGDLPQNAVSIYPNPTNGLLEVASDNNISSIALYDATGKMVINQPEKVATLRTRLDLSVLHNGIYFIEVKTKNGIIRERIIKI
ncbi:MAG: hypothetical protein Kow0075_17170 [Salibacteraceae bacterium]